MDRRRSPHRGAHVFVDETKAKGFIMVATWIRPSDVAQVRRQVRQQIPAGQHRLHFTKLSDRRRKQAIVELAALPVVVRIHRSDLKDRRAARGEALRSVLTEAVAWQAGRVVIERDLNFVRFDLGVVHEVGCGDAGITVHHLRSVEDALLWISDAIAWCLQRGGPWAAAIGHLTKEELG